MSTMNDVTAPRSADTAAPARASGTGLAVPLPATVTEKTTTLATTAPARANQTVAPVLVTPKTYTPSTTASPAPEETPNRPGSASGFRVCPCMSSPAIPSAAPTAAPMSVRGMRDPQTTASAVLDPVRVSPATTWSTPRRLLPNSMLATAAATSATTRTATTSRRRRTAVRCTPSARGAVSVRAARAGVRTGSGSGTEAILG